MLLYFLLGLTIGFVFVFVASQFLNRGQTAIFGSKIEEKINEVFPHALKEANEQLVLMAEQKLGAEKKEIKTDLENKRNNIKELVERFLNELGESNKKLEKAERDRIGSFQALKKEVETQNQVTKDLSTTTEGLRRVLSNNQLRGEFGEQVAEDLLKMAGFVRGIDYEFNKEQMESRTRPDFCVFLPDGTRINVDSKFPYNNLQRAVETEDKETKERCLKYFERDIKEKIRQVTSRDYINPESRTVDFVIMFIPNEMIFSYIYDTMHEVWVDAMRRKVILAGPFSFTAILRMVRQAHDNFRYQKNVYQIVQHIKNFEKEFAKFSEEFEKIGSKIESLSDQYQKVSITRTNQLQRTVDKIRLDGPDQPQKLVDAPRKTDLS